MTYLNILGDGSVYPPLRPYDLVIKLSREVIQAGKYVQEKFLGTGTDYIDSPINSEEIKEKVLAKIQQENPQLFEKKHDLHLLCPREISCMAQWPARKEKFQFTFSKEY